MPIFVSRLRDALAKLLILTGAGMAVGGALGPWAQIVLFKNIDISLPGIFFAGGGLCLAVGVLVLLGGRRSPLLSLLGALFVIGWTQTARQDLPHRVKHQVIGAQMALFPINRLLDQFHIVNIEVGDWNIPNGQLLGSGLNWTEYGGLLLVLGSALALPRDPVVLWIYARAVPARCRACGARWSQERAAAFCPDCGLSTSSAHRCSSCGTIAETGDVHCIACGAALPAE